MVSAVRNRKLHNIIKNKMAVGKFPAAIFGAFILLSAWEPAALMHQPAVRDRRGSDA